MFNIYIQGSMLVLKKCTKFCKDHISGDILTRVLLSTFRTALFVNQMLFRLYNHLKNIKDLLHHGV